MSKNKATRTAKKPARTKLVDRETPMARQTQFGPMTPRQKVILAAMVGHCRKFLIPPSIRDIGEYCGIKSPNGVVCHVRALVKRGEVVKIGGRISRGYVPVVIAELIRGESVVA